MVMGMPISAAMPAVHEHVHQRAGQQNQIWQDTQRMGAVFREQEKSGNGEKTIKR